MTRAGVRPLSLEYSRTGLLWHTIPLRHKRTCPRSTFHACLLCDLARSVSEDRAGIVIQCEDNLKTGTFTGGPLRFEKDIAEDDCRRLANAHAEGGYKKV